MKMEEAAWVATHVNEFNTIINQVSSVRIELDDKVLDLILLASLLNSWEPMIVAFKNSVESMKLKFNTCETHSFWIS